MFNYLCVSVTFLDPVSAFHGRGNGGEPEWPPSPLRLFQALLAGATNRWCGAEFQEHARPALEWLQQREVSIIIAPSHHVGTPLRIAVPNNDLDVAASAWAKRQEPKKQPNQLKTMKTVRPTRLLVGKNDPATVHYLFPLACDGCQHLEVLRASARSITHLGWGVDMVAANASVVSEEEIEKLRGERWRCVVDKTGNRLRVPVDGSLQALIDRHERFLGRIDRDAKGNESFKPVPPLSTFRELGYRRTTDSPARPFAAFRLLHPEEDRMAWFSPTRANVVAAMTRHATAGAAEHHRPRDWIDAHVHGHRSAEDDAKPRFSYLPLPSIERRGERGCVVGGIRRVLVAELNETPTSQLGWARQMLPGQFLIDEASSDKKAMLAPLGDGDWVLRQYTGPSDTWATTTPVVLPGSDDGKFAKAEKLFYKALRHAGHSPEGLAEFEFRNVSFWPGGDLALRFQRPDYLRRDHWSVYHMRLRWKQPIQGPLAIGAGRHCGLGIFASVQADQ